MSPGLNEPSRLGPQGRFCQEKQTGGLRQKMPGEPSSGYSLRLVWTPVWLIVVCLFWIQGENGELGVKPGIKRWFLLDMSGIPGSRREAGDLDTWVQERSWVPWAPLS